MDDTWSETVEARMQGDSISVFRLKLQKQKQKQKCLIIFYHSKLSHTITVKQSFSEINENWGN